MLNKRKILIVITSLSGGGAERFACNLSCMLHNLGHDIHIVTILNKVAYDYRGTLLNLGLHKDENNSFSGKIKRFVILKKYIKSNNFDFIIDNRTKIKTLTELAFSVFLYNKIKIVHIIHSYFIESYFPKNKFIVNLIYKTAYQIVCVSNDIKTRVEDEYRFANCTTIYNPVDVLILEDLSKKFTVNAKYILSYGRLDDNVKNFSLLIDAYATSVLPNFGIKLYIIGDGKDKKLLIDKVVALHLQNSVIFKEKISNTFPYVKKALFITLTSKHEGFPLVVLESLALGTPVVSVNCKSGPSEIIVHENNGLLVENNNVVVFANAINQMFFDEELYLKCKNNARNSVQHLSYDQIGLQWQKILGV